MPFPVLMWFLTAALTFIQGFSEMEISPELIRPIFLPPLLFAPGAMVAQPDAVAVESMAGRVHMPCRRITMLQSERLVNDATAIVIVIVQAEVEATVSGTKFSGDVVLQFVLGSAIAVPVGISVGWLTSLMASSAVTLVPFAA